MTPSITQTSAPVADSHVSFYADDLTISFNQNPTQFTDPRTLMMKMTDHMLQANWNVKTGWSAPAIIPYAPLPLDPACSVLHYGTECFEGLKAWRNKKTGKVHIFRPDLNARRMNKSCDRIALPSFSDEEFVKLLLKFVQIEKRFLAWEGEVEMADEDDHDFLYLRPIMIGTTPQLGVATPSDAMFLIIASRIPAYNSKPLRLLASSPEQAVRAWPGGFGAAKVGGNYGPTMRPMSAAAKHGYDQILWLFDPERRLVTEAGAANFFVVWSTPAGKTEIVTAPLSNGTILDGVTRRSVLELARERLACESLEVIERDFGIDEVVKAHEEGRLIEAFACGTAFFVAPVAELGVDGRDIKVPLESNGKSKSYAQTIKKWLTEIFTGEVEHRWAAEIE
ncbi:aminotransferase [Myxozyma melibiosi]|uniref:Branched-chain-amino-acid aminotransferase n=1 Tax=Myxozyma melibiosi TaxID=54550 RepID=A0ABR1FD86_9ASCO